MATEVWSDALLFLDGRELEKCQLISKRFCGMVSANTAKMALRRIARAEIVSGAKNLPEHLQKVV